MKLTFTTSHITQSVLLMLLLLCQGIHLSWPQESSHNRIGVQSTSPCSLDLGISLSLDSYLLGSETAILNMQPYVAMLLHNRYYISTSLPLYLQLPLVLENTPPVAFALGDLYLEGSAITHTNSGQHRLTLSWSFSTGNDSLEAQAYPSLHTGSYLHRISIAWLSTRYLDPVSIDAGIRVDTSIPGQRENSFYWEPGSLALDLAITVLLNKQIAIRYSLSPSIALPPIIGAQWEYPVLLPSMYANLSFYFTRKAHTLSLSITCDYAKPGNSCKIGAAYVYTIKNTKRKEPQE